MHKTVDVLLIALSSPILVGIYEECKLVETIVSEEKSSDVLPKIYNKLLKEYKIQNLFYANGPGSFMAIKVAYIFLKSISILKNIPLYATDAFKFNNNQPIKAIGKLCFVKISSKIQTKKIQVPQQSHFVLPQLLDYDEFEKNTTPIYGIGAV